MTMIEGTRNEIVLSGDPKGHFLEGYISGTPKPGTICTIKAATSPIGKKWTWEAWTRATGANGLIAVLVNNYDIGQNVTTAYVTGAWCKLYVPVAGDELQVLFGNASGTADDVAVGTLLIVETTTGKVIPTASTPEREPFEALEAIVDPTADQLLHVYMTGS